MVRFRWVVAVVAGLVLGGGAGLAAPLHSRLADSRVAAADMPRPSPQRQSSPAAGQSEMRIAAVVNNQVISVYDLISRMRMIMLSSNIPDTPEMRRRIAGQVLRSLIDEKLELQEAKRLGVTASDKEIKAALARIEAQNNMRPGQLNAYLKARGIDRGTLVQQLTASLVWAKLVRRRAAQTVEITDDEIDAAMKRLKKHANEPESRVAEIFLTVDNPSQDAEVRALAERLTQQMRRGARFSAIARQFSKSATAAVGGDMGWLRPDQLPPKLGEEVSKLHVGELSPPIRAAGGYYLLLVLGRRSGSGGRGGEVYDIVQVVFPLPAHGGAAARRTAIDEAASIRGAAKDCPSLLKIGKERAPQLSSEGKLRENEISPQMRNLLARLPVGKVSEPIVQRNGVGVVMVCSKTKEGGGGITREAVAHQLLRQRLDTVARRYLRDLRRAAYVDVRM